MSSDDENTLSDSGDADAARARGMPAADMPNWLVRHYLELIYGDLDRLFSIPLRKPSTRLDLTV